ncbi:MAG: DNA polymerase III subunit gamma and tau [Cellulomonas sp.]|uniref:DNA polymerase III subunit gamma and tau n=1 Tax=Cellulomonas sp. TaxID=40001 RepID=UPI002586A5B6|nr:DNA polymerase III subunit gamma and tau [Cellulomonas sp.]MCR6704665.1 DNA polymerase III subunit gamma and tau [Cellulomonas sp.]
MTTALYRRYRPETFAEVIGQDHVTAPLRQALRTGQVNHAYLFSGPRGCGKTTSARILARILNCAQNTEASPTDTPCGTCPSCVELARGGPGSLDVVEIDAASHGGVDDARELRERATFAPARDRFKIFILDEAHMVSNQGFNALLKIVEEPPPHVKFVFATTEPDKVIGTIRSRTHHYPFRLVPPDVLLPYLEQLCEAERVPVGGGVLPLVVRAGGGSVRDTLSVLDQLIAGSDASGIEYGGAAALLGYTQASLLDDLVDAIAAGDGGAAFRVVERVISTGHEPRRFVEDLLERLRDLIVIDAAGDAAGAALRGLPEDQLATMRVQSARLGSAELSRSADLANAALTEMTGATSPRLHLELLMARLLLPAADDERTGLAARLDRLERGLPAAAHPGPSQPAPRGESPRPAARDEDDAPAAPAPRLAPGARPADAVRAALAASRSGARPDDARPTAPPAPVPASDAAPSSAAVSAPATAPVVADDRAGAPGAGTGSPAPSGAVPDEPLAEPAPFEHPSDERVTDEPEPTDTPAESAPAAPASAQPAAAERAGGEAAGDDAPAAVDVAGAEPEPDGAVASGDADDEADAGSVADVPFESVPSAVSGETEVLRRRWPEVLETVKSLRRVTGALVDPNNAQVAELDATTLRLAFTTPELANTFRNGPHAEVVARAVHETLGFDVRVEASAGDVRAGSAPSGRGAASSQRPSGRQSGGSSTGRAPQARPGEVESRASNDEQGADDAEPHRAPSTANDQTGPGQSFDAAPERHDAQDEHHGWEPPDEPEDPWATAPPDAASATSGPSAPSSSPSRSAAESDRPTPTPTPTPSPDPARRVPAGASSSETPAVEEAPAVPGVISAADAAASWDLPARPAPTRGAAPVAAQSTPDRVAAPSAGSTALAAAQARASQAARTGTGAGAESAVARAQRLAAAAPQRPAPGPRAAAPPPEHDPYDDLSPDDPDVASSGLVGAPLVAQILGGTVIDEQIDDGRS